MIDYHLRNWIMLKRNLVKGEEKVATQNPTRVNDVFFEVSYE